MAIGDVARHDRAVTARLVEALRRPTHTSGVELVGLVQQLQGSGKAGILLARDPTGRDLQLQIPQELFAWHGLALRLARDLRLYHVGTLRRLGRDDRRLGF